MLCLCGRNDTLRAKVVGALRRRAAAAGHGLHRPDGRRARRRRRARALQRRPHRARGDHPRLPGRLLRLRLRPRARLQRGAGALQAGPGGAAREPDLVPAIQRALEHRPEPDPPLRAPAVDRVADPQPTSAASVPLPRWRVRTVRAATSHRRDAGARRLGPDHRRLLLAGLALHAHPAGDRGHHRSARGRRAHRRARVPRSRRWPRTLSAYGIHASFARRPAVVRRCDDRVLQPGDQALPAPAHRRPGAVAGRPRRAAQAARARWATSHHFLYASSGPSIGQWLVANGAGGKLVEGAVRLQDADDSLGSLRPGEVVEFTWSSAQAAEPLLGKLLDGLHEEHLDARSRSGALMQDAGKTTADLSATGSPIELDDVRARGGAPGGRRPPHPGARPPRTLDDARRRAGVRSRARRSSAMGAFKFRGAYNAISSLVGRASSRGGVCAVSSGNHAQAVALAARLCGTPRGDPHARRRAGAQARRHRGLRRRGGRVRPLRRGPRGAGPPARRRARHGAGAPVRQSAGDGRPGHGGAGAARRGRRARRAGGAGRRRRADLGLRHRVSRRCRRGRA